MKTKKEQYKSTSKIDAIVFDLKESIDDLAHELKQMQDRIINLEQDKKEN